jgi:hypothetical protein
MPSRHPGLPTRRDCPAFQDRPPDQFPPWCVIRLSGGDFSRGIASLGKGVITGGVVGELRQQEGGIGGQFDLGWKMAGGKQGGLSPME